MQSRARVTGTGWHWISSRNMDAWEQDECCIMACLYWAVKTPLPAKDHEIIWNRLDSGAYFWIYSAKSGSPLR